MKLATKVNEFHTNRVSKSVGYRVANSVHTMEILSNLYADPLLATIRELSTNASDSHVENGNEHVPFKVTLPTRDKPKLTIRDFGPGLSPDKMQDVYTVYGVSDKGDSNEFTGCLGLGSKSPFTYTDLWTTISYHKGIKYTGINATNERGRPTFNILHTEPTASPDGLEVSFDIKPEDINKCREKAEKVYQWFKLCPKSDIQLESAVKARISSRENNFSTEFVGSNWNIFTGSSYSRGVSYATMGQIRYEIKDEHFTGTVKSLIYHGLALDFNIGDLDFAPSRDGLKYTRHTISTIENRVNEILNTIKATMIAKITTCRFEWDANVKLTELVRGDSSSIYKIVAPTITFRGKNLSGTYFLQSNSLTGIDTSKFYKFFRNHKGGVSKKNDSSIIVESTTVFVVNNDKGKGHAQVRRQVLLAPDKTYYLYIADDNIASPGINYITKTLGVNPADILLTSKCHKGVGSTKSTTTASKRPSCELQCRVFTDNARYRSCNQDYWGVDIIDNVDVGNYIYVVLGKDLSVLGNRSIESQRLNEIVKRMNKPAGLNIYGLTELRAEKIKGKKNWKKFDIFYKEYLDKWHSIEDNVRSTMTNANRDSFTQYNDLKQYLSPNTLMYTFLKTFNNTLKLTDTDNVANLVMWYTDLVGDKYIVPQHHSVPVFDTTLLNAKYPMLELLDEYKISTQGRSYRTVKDEDLQTVARYINSIG